MNKFTKVWVARFCDEWLGSADRRDGAIAIAIGHAAARWES